MKKTHFKNVEIFYGPIKKRTKIFEIKKNMASGYF